MIIALFTSLSRNIPIIDKMLSLYLLGPFYVWQTEPEAPIVLSRTTRALLAYLAATGQPHFRHVLMDLFCPDVDDPRSALRSLLSLLRQKLGSQIFLAEGGTIRFNSAVAWVDCLDFANSPETDLASLSVETLTHAIDLYRGDFLINVTLSNSPDFEFWSLNERARCALG